MQYTLERSGTFTHRGRETGHACGSDAATSYRYEATLCVTGQLKHHKRKFVIDNQAVQGIIEALYPPHSPRARQSCEQMALTICRGLVRLLEVE